MYSLAMEEVNFLTVSPLSKLRITQRLMESIFYIMKIYHVIRFILLVILACSVPCFATAVGISTIEQPVNLGVHSDPTRIPLGKVAVISNHEYGIHSKIGESRPCPQGAMIGKNGSELDQNLASVFGVSVEAMDPTQILANPVTLRLNAWKPPGYSPYTKEQVLAATLWCLIRSTNSSPENPLEVRVVAEGVDDKALEAKYSGKYFRDADKDKKIAPTSKVGGTTIEEDARGIAWVVLPDVAHDKAFKPLTPAMIICENFGEGDTGWFVLPVWGNGENTDDFLKLNHYSVNMCYSAYNTYGLRNANSFVDEAGSKSFDVSRLEKSDEVSMSYVRFKPETLAANILALIIATQPTADRPLTVSFSCEQSAIENYAAFRKASGWQEIHNQGTTNYYQLTCEFAWDPKTHKLLKGSLPAVTTNDSKWITPLHDKE